MDDILKSLNNGIKIAILIFVLILLSPLLFFLFDNPGEKTNAFKESSYRQSEYEMLANDLIGSYGFSKIETKTKDTYKKVQGTDSGHIYSVSYYATLDGKINYENLYKLMLELDELQLPSGEDVYSAGIITITQNNQHLMFQLNNDNKLVYAGLSIIFDYDESGEYIPDKPFTHMDAEDIENTGYGEPDDIRDLDNGQTAYIWITNNKYGYVAYVNDGYVQNTATEQVIK